MSKQIKQWEITYTNKWSGRTEVHVNTNNKSDGEGWAKVLSSDHGCKAECHEVYTDGSRKHVLSVGDR